jgi:hypothetical protein
VCVLPSTICSFNLFLSGYENFLVPLGFGEFISGISLSYLLCLLFSLLGMSILYEWLQYLKVKNRVA